MCGGKTGKIFNPAKDLIMDFTGVNDQIDATNRNADAQYAATAQATRDQQAALMATAQAAADQQTTLVARQDAQAKAEAAASAPLETAEVSIDAPTTESGSATRARRRKQFGQSYSGGVQL